VHCHSLTPLHYHTHNNIHVYVCDDNRFRFVVELPAGRVTFVFPAQYLITVVRGAADSNTTSSSSSSSSSKQLTEYTDNSAAVKKQRDNSSSSGSGISAATGGVSSEQQQQQQQQQHVLPNYSYDSSSANSTSASNAAASYSGAVLAAGLQGFDTAPNSSSDVFSDDGGLWHTHTTAASVTAYTSAADTSIDDAAADSSFVQSPRSRAAALAHSAATQFVHTDADTAAAVPAAAAVAEEPVTLFAEPLETVLQEESVLQDDVDLTSSDHWPRGPPAQTEYSSSPLRHAHDAAAAAVYSSSGAEQQQQQQQQSPLYDAGVSTAASTAAATAAGAGLFDYSEQYQQQQQQQYQQQQQPHQYEQQQQQQYQYQYQQDESLAAADSLFGSDSGDKHSAATSSTSAAATAWRLPSPTISATTSSSPTVTSAAATAADAPATLVQPLSSTTDAAAAFAAFSDDTDWLSGLSAAPVVPVQQHVQQREHANTIDNSSALAHEGSGDSGHAFLAAAAAAAGAVERSASCDVSFLQHLQHTVAIPLDSGSSAPSVDAAFDAAADAFPTSSVNDSTATDQQQSSTSSSAEVPSDVI
jgi:hypothetical protein